MLVVEHNTDVINSADWVIDLGPEPAMLVETLSDEGVPEGLKKVKESFTGKYL